MKQKTKWTWAWVLWLVIFLATELPAAIRKSKLDTLSEQVWEWFGVRSTKPYSRARRALLFAFMLVLSSHFIFGWPGGAAVIVAGFPVGIVILYALVRE